MKKAIDFIGVFCLSGMLIGSSAWAASVRQAEFRTVNECLAAIEQNTGMSLSIIRNTKEIVTGNLANGQTFACERTESGTKGIYYKGWFMVND